MASSRNHTGADGDDGDAMQFATQNNPVVPVQEPTNSIKDSTGKDGATLLDNGVVGVVNEVNEVDEHENNNNNGGSAANAAAVDAKPAQNNDGQDKDADANTA